MQKPREPRPSAVNMALPAVAVVRRVAAPLLLSARCQQLLIDISCPRSAQQQTQTRRTPIDGTDRQTDGLATVS